MTDKYTPEGQVPDRENFLKTLENMLQDIPEEEREAALSY